MATRTTIGDGDWSDTDNWVDGIIPVDGDDALINGNNMIMDIERIPATGSLNSLKGRSAGDGGDPIGGTLAINMSNLDAPEIHALTVMSRGHDSGKFIVVTGDSEDKMLKIVTENITLGGQDYNYCITYTPSVAGTLHLIGNISTGGYDSCTTVEFNPAAGAGTLIIDGNILGCEGSESTCVYGVTHEGASATVIINGTIAPLSGYVLNVSNSFGVLFTGEGIDITITGNISSDGFVDSNSDAINAVSLPAESVVTIIGDMTSAPFWGCYAVTVAQPSVLSFDGSLIFNEGVPPLYCGGGYGTVVFIGGNNRYVQIYDTIFPLQLATSFGSNPFRRFRRLI